MKTLSAQPGSFFCTFRSDFFISCIDKRLAEWYNLSYVSAVGKLL